MLGCAGLDLDDWQASFHSEALRLDYDDRFVAFEVVAVVPRQNGKGGILEARQITGLYVLGEELQIHTAHEFKTCAEHFLRVKSLIEGSPELMSRVRIIRTGSGDQGIELKTGERLRFVARSRSAIRGFSPDVVYFDEAFELTEKVTGNVVPAMSARDNPQVWYTSSAPHYGSTVLHSLLRRAEGNESERADLFLRAWESSQGTRHSDVKAWRRVNPALDIRIDEDFVRKEMQTLGSTPEGVSEFRRERLGIREGGDGESGIVPVDKWDDLVIPAPDPKRVESLSFGLASSGDGWSAIGSAGRFDGALYIDSVDYRRGSHWVQKYLEGLFERTGVPIRIDPSDPANLFIRPLRDAGVDVVEVGGREYQQACGELLAAVNDGGLRHIGQPALDRAVASVGRRAVGREGSWAWARPGAEDVSPLKAATLALSGVERKRKPKIHVLEATV